MKEGFYRVTQILERFSDFGSIPNEVLLTATDRGTRVHDYCSSHALGGTLLNIDDDCAPYFDSFTQWFDKYVTTVHFSEERFYDEKKMLTGKIDLYCFSEEMGGNIIIDIKTPQNYIPIWQLQIAAYQKLMENQDFHPKIDRNGCLMLNKNGKMARYIPLQDYETIWNLFEGLLNIHVFLNICNQCQNRQ